MNRRHFLHTSAGLALGSLAWGSAGCTSDAGSQAGTSASTGTNQLTAIGVQLYTVRSLMADDFEGTLRSIADIGYDEVEFAGYYERSPSAVRGILDDLGLAAPSAHVSLDQLRDDLDVVVETAQTIGHEYVICPWLPQDEHESIADYRTLAQFFNEVGAQLQDAGLQFGYHNHAFEFESIDDERPYDVLLDETDPEYVTMELDLYWIIDAGHDPISYFEQYPGRFALCHVKDRTAEGAMAAVGTGTIDFPSIFAQHEQAGLQKYIVEHDNPESPLASLRSSYEYLSALRF